ncbi:MAG TPA: filamentous hemagglutinin N-terminal domain-containing protein, partial [Enterobacteriaceae bacterium]|nr:filamentous hemagglutinin N-terminal domain-containing protein [Enterobacteriaceae bacterium]
MAGQSRSKRAYVQDRIKVSPLVEAMTLALIGLASTPLLAQAATPVGSGWFSSSQGVNNAVRARAGLTGGNAGIEAARVRQQQQARLTLQRSVQNLERTAAAIAAQQASQKAARDAANAAPGNVLDGIGKGGLWDKDQNGKQLAWSGADRAVQTESGGKTTVVIKQTASKAILNWDTFNVGRNTTVNFDQNSTDAVLNRVVGDEARPSQILGAINGKGSVMVANQNGVVFSGSSQVNVRNLAVAAATITDEQFRNNGLYVDTQGTQPTFRDAKGDVIVNAGAQITTSAPASSTADGGYVLLVGANVTNAGQITTPSGQTIMAAGDSFIIRKGVGTESNAASTTAGHEVSAQRAAGSLSGRVENSGLIAATTGDITLTGHEVVQSGVAVATTSTSKRGTLHLSTRASDTTGSVTLAKGSTTAIVLDASKGTALDSQRDAALKRLDGNTPNPMATGNFDNLSTLTDRRDLSRVEIVSGNTVAFEADSMALATGGEMAVSAVKRTLVDNGATLDVSGAIGVQVAMENNNLAIDVQGNEQRDSAVNRDSQNLNSSKMWVDRRNLVFVPAGTNGYATDRWYTAGGLLEVGGYLATSGHSVGEWMAQGGTVTMSGGDLVTRSGSAINLSGGTLDVQSGNIRQSWLKGSDGRLYELSRAPGDLLYTGLYNGYELTSKRWGQTTQFYNPLIGSSQRYEAGYTVGRDAGKLVVSTRNAVLEGSIVSDIWQGDNQTRAAQQGLDGYNQSQYSVARAGQLIVGRYTPVYGNGVLRHELNPVLDRVILSDETGTLADGVQLEDAVANERQGELRLDTDLLNDSGLGAVRIAAAKEIDVDSTLRVTPGGEIVLYAPDVEVGADLVAHSGTVRLGNVLNQTYAGAVKGETDDR